MSNQATAGARFRAAVREEQPLQVVGAINANHALLAQQAGFRAIYLSGGGVAAGSLGLPDLGISGLEDVLVDVRRITDVCELPLLVANSQSTSGSTRQRTSSPSATSGRAMSCRGSTTTLTA